jgi:hypothetical protein
MPGSYLCIVGQLRATHGSAGETTFGTLRSSVTFRRRASLPAATGAPERAAAVAGDHGIGVGRSGNREAWQYHTGPAQSHRA